MSALDELKPCRKRLVFDLAEEAGLDMSDWKASSNSPAGYKANPKYCYSWSLLTPGRVLILNLWFDTLHEAADGAITCAENYRQDAAELRAQQGKSKWIERGLAFDNQLQEAARDALPIRVIVNHGVRRTRGDAAAEPSRVQFRDLDSETWHIRAYDHDTGAFELARGIASRSLADQFDLIEALPERKEAVRLVLVRDPSVRRAALARSGGRCELCGADGFLMDSGARYLETHHILPLGEGGPDSLVNVIALCPNDHRRAHFEIGRTELRDLLRARIVH